VLVGAGGYLGSRLATWLADESSQTTLTVRNVMRRSSPEVPGERIVVDLLSDDGPPALAVACKDADAVIHLAGPNEVATTADPQQAVADTIRLSQRVADAASLAGVHRLVYVSTIHVYGARLTPGARITEDLRPEPRSPYAIARLASEHLLSAALSDSVIFRLTNSVGAPLSPAIDRWSLVANDLCRQAVTSGSLRLRTPGTQWRDFVALSDACRVLVGSVGADAMPAGIYNLGSGRPSTIRQLAQLVQDRAEVATGQRPILIAPEPPPDPPGPYTVSTERLAATGWRATTPLANAIDETLAFCLTHRQDLLATGQP
jgi:UDP-glucose 4-epimerase